MNLFLEKQHLVKRVQDEEVSCTVSTRARKRICLISSVHNPFDSRIFAEAHALADAGYDVCIVGPHDKDEIVDGVQIFAVPRSKKRTERYTRTAWQVCRRALRLRPDAYHFHDPEFMVPAVLLKVLTRKKVVFDIHEHYSLDALQRAWIPVPLRRSVRWLALGCSRACFPFYDALVFATASIMESVPSHRHRFVLRNYCDLPEGVHEQEHESNLLVYAGTISPERGFGHFLEAFKLMRQRIPVRLRLLGNDSEILGEFRKFPPEIVEVYPRTRHDEALRIIATGTLGLGLDLPLPGSDGPSMKYFEYMALGLPIVSADLPIMRAIVEQVGCGIAVDYRKPEQVADQIVELLQSPGRIEEMRQRGREAYQAKYNWKAESGTLLGLYRELLGPKSGEACHYARPLHDDIMGE